MGTKLPYIPQEQRPELDPAIRMLVRDLSHEFSAAQLNYVVCKLVNEYINHHGLRYPHICEVQGMFHGAAREFDRCVADPYEALKKADNGTVWTCAPKPPPHPDQPLVVDNVDVLRWSDILGPHDGPDGYTPIDMPEEIYCEETHQRWMKCRHENCDLHLAAPGVIDCSGYCLEDDDLNQ